MAVDIGLVECFVQVHIQRAQTTNKLVARGQLLNC